jgi:hypothetical protein
MQSRSAVVLAAVLRAFRPLARLLLRHGVAYPSFAVALKQVFLEAAVEELQRTGQKQTDSAISLLSGVHRRDVRNIARGATAPVPLDAPMNMASQVVSRWLADGAWRDRRGRAKTLPRTGDAGSFEALVASISSDVRPRAVLDELVRLGIAEEKDSQVRLLERGFVPRQGFDEMAALLRDNLHDHAAAAALNLDGERNYLEQAIFVDELTQASVERLHAVSAQAWRRAFDTVMAEAQARYDHDQEHATPGTRVHRARFGSYFYASDKDDQAT